MARMLHIWHNAAAVVAWFSVLAGAADGDAVPVFVQDSATDEDNVGAVCVFEVGTVLLRRRATAAPHSRGGLLRCIF